MSWTSLLFTEKNQVTVLLCITDFSSVLALALSHNFLSASSFQALPPQEINFVPLKQVVYTFIYDRWY